MAIERHGLSAGSQNALPRAGQEPGCAVTLAVARLYVSLPQLPIVTCLPGPKEPLVQPLSAVYSSKSDPDSAATILPTVDSTFSIFERASLDSF